MNNSDPLARERGADMASDIERLKRLQAALAAFRDPSFVQRLVAIAGDFDVATARLAWDDFEPAVPTSAGAFAIGILGLFGGWAATHLCAWPIRQRLRKRRARRLAEAA
jgi:hypothetical protein